MKNLTERQKEVLDYIAQFTDDAKFPPTVREIGEHFKISLRAVQDHVAALQKKGYISICQKRSRSIRVLKDVRQSSEPVPVKVPVVSDVNVALRVLGGERGEEYMTFSEPFVDASELYVALRVKGNAMQDAGIVDGDVAVIKRTAVAEDGQIVAVILDNALAIKRFFREDSRICLRAENPEFQTIYCQTVHIVGTLAFTVRQFN